MTRPGSPLPARGDRRRRALPLVLALWLALAGAAFPAELIERSRHVWTGAGADFGGFSALAVTDAGAGLLALSDRGVLFRADVARDPAGRITAVKARWQGRLRDNLGKPVSGFTEDAEAMAMAADGSIVVGFEGYARIARFRPPDMMPEPLGAWDRFRDLWGNEGIESLVICPDGGLMAILEVAGSDGAYPTLIGADGGDWRPGPAIPADGDFAASDASFGADGRLYLLERHFGYLSGFSTRIRRFDLDGGRFGADGTLLLTAPGALDNMEGVSLWLDPAGRQMMTLIADDNFRALQETLIVDYELFE